MTWVAAGSGVVSVLGGMFGASAAEKAAQQQAAAEMAAVNLQKQEFNTITQQEQPFMQGGYQALGQLQYALGEGTPGQGNVPTSSPSGNYGSLLQPFTADTFKQYSPAYAFQAEQGRQGTLNGDTAGAGALSGAAQKDLMGFNQEFANSSFNNAFNQYTTQQSNIYSRLAGLVQGGQNAAANTGQQGASMAQSMGQNLSNIGTAQAGGTIGAANAFTGGLNNALGSIYALNGGNGGWGGGNSYLNFANSQVDPGQQGTFGADYVEGGD